MIKHDRHKNSMDQVYRKFEENKVILVKKIVK